MSADVLVVGAGFAGLVVARGAAAAVRSVLVVERGATKSHGDQPADGRHERPGSLTTPVHETGPEQPAYPWAYALAVVSLADELVVHTIPPFAPLPQSWLSVPVAGRPACCADTNCGLCPVDAKTTVLDAMRSERLLERGVSVLEGTAVARLERDGPRIVAAHGVNESGRSSRIEAEPVVMAAGDFENPAILQRAGLDGPEAGRWLFDHSHRLVHVFSQGILASHGLWDGGEGSHQLGTCFITESTGVVDGDLRPHELEDLRIVGGSAFPSDSAHHPTLTICVLAIRLGAALGAGR